MATRRLRKRIELDEEFAVEAEDDSEEEAAAKAEHKERLGRRAQEPDLYPERGVYPQTKAILIHLIDSKGGLKGWNRQNKVLDSICNEYPEHFGKKDSELRWRVKNLVAHWKRDESLLTKARKSTSSINAAGLLQDAATKTQHSPVSSTQALFDHVRATRSQKAMSANLFSSPTSTRKLRSGGRRSSSKYRDPDPSSSSGT